MFACAKNARGGARTVFNMPNKISEYRKPFVANPHLHGADNPTFLKAGQSDEMFLWIGAGACGFVLLMVGRGMYNMALGVGKLE